MALLARSPQFAAVQRRQASPNVAVAPRIQHGHVMSRRRTLAQAGRVQKITGEQLEVEIQDRDRPLIVDFFATWCGPCLLLAQELEKAAEQLGDSVKILKIDVDENPVLSSQLRIEGLPTIVFIPKDGSRPALRTEGLLPADQIVDIVKEMTTPTPPQ